MHPYICNPVLLSAVKFARCCGLAIPGSMYENSVTRTCQVQMEPRSSCVAGSCQMPVQEQQPTYQTCAIMGGAQLANGNLMNLAKAQFKFKPANCSYSSKPHKGAPDLHPQSAMCLMVVYNSAVHV